MGKFSMHAEPERTQKCRKIFWVEFSSQSRSAIYNASDVKIYNATSGLLDEYFLSQ
jgi:hypothetical protein